LEIRLDNQQRALIERLRCLGRRLSGSLHSSTIAAVLFSPATSAINLAVPIGQLFSFARKLSVLRPSAIR